MTFLAAATLHIDLTRLALNKQNVTYLPSAIDMGVSFFATSVAVCNHVVGDALSHAGVENEVFADKLIVERFFLYLAIVVDNATV